MHEVSRRKLAQRLRRSRWIIAAALSAMPVRAFGQQIPILGETYAHDPAPVTLDGSSYFYYSTGQGILSRTSTNLSNWSDGPAVFASAPSWTTTAVPGFTGDFWAPDVAYFNGLYHMYYAVSTFGSQVSAIGMATSPTLNSSSPNYAWADQGPVIQSTNGSAYNTIDPDVMTTPGGAMWMTFGSYWTGIYEVQLNTATGMVQSGATPVHLAQRSGSDTSDEASYLYYHNGYYYLFSNWGSCCQGVNSTYNVRMGRSTSVTGPFVDASGASLLSGGGTLFLGAQGNYIGPGQVGIITVNGQDLVSYHYYNGANNGTPAFALQDLYWTSSGWPTTIEPMTWSASTTGTNSVDGGGSWTLSQTNFQYNSSGHVWNNSGYGGITFGNGNGQAGVVTLAQNVTTANITFNTPGSGNYNISGGGFSIGFSNSVTGAMITTNSAATIAAPMTGGALTTNGNATLTLTGPVTLTNFFPRQGAVALTGTAALTTAATPVSTADNFSSIGQQAGDSATVTLSGNASLTVAGDLNIADVSANGVLNIQGNAVVHPRTFFVGKYGNSTGTVNQTGGVVQEADNGAAPGDWRIGGAGSASDSAAVGIYNLSGGSFSTTSNFQVGAYGHGTFTQTAGTVTIGAYLSIGRFPGGVGLYDLSTGNGTLNASNAAFAIVGEQASGTLKIGGSSTVNATGLGVGYNNGAVGTVIQTGGTVNLGSNGLQFGTVASSSGSTASGSYTLSGGTLITSSIWQNANSNVTGTFKFNGGTLEPLLNNSSLVPAGLKIFEVQTGAATVNTKGNNTSIFAALTHDPALGSTPDGGLIKAGLGTLTLGAAETYTGSTNITGGTLDLSGVNQTFTSLTGSTGTALTLGSATLTLKTATASTYNGIISGSGNLIMAGNGMQILGGADTFTGSITVQSGTLDLGINPNTGIQVHTSAGIAIASGASLLTDAAPVAGNRALIITSTLLVASGGKLNLANNDMDVAGGSLSSITGQIATAYNLGHWNGPGITSSTAASNTAHLTAIGVIQNNQGGSTLFTAANPFDGTTPGTGDILAKYTYYGDSNLDGKVDGTDYSRIDNGYLANLTGWYNGDFNYDGIVNGSDYTLIDNAFNSQAAAITSQMREAAIAAEISVPEPVSVGVMGFVLILTLRRRQRGQATA